MLVQFKLMQDQFIRDNGQMEKDMDLENTYILMDQFMKGNGITINSKDMGELCFLTGIIMKANGRTIRHGEPENMLRQMELHIMGNGWMINNMEKEQKNGKMAKGMRETIQMAKNWIWPIFGLMVPNMKEVCLMECLMEMVNTHGKMEKGILSIQISIKGSGCLIKCMVMEFIFGLMEKYTKEILKKIKEKEMGNWIGRMVEFIKATGKMVNNMEKENLFIKIKSEKEFGKMGSQQNGVIVNYYEYNEYYNILMYSFSMYEKLQVFEEYFDEIYI